MFAHAIVQLEPSIRGVHLIWMGIPAWIYSPGGWYIQRRKSLDQVFRFHCDSLDAAALKLVRRRQEILLSCGALTMRNGSWPAPIQSLDHTNITPTPCEIYTLELNKPQPAIRVSLQAQNSFIIARRAGKVVASAGPAAGNAQFTLTALAIDTVIIYTVSPSSIQLCVSPVTENERAWDKVPFLVEKLQLPFKELMPSISDEYLTAKSRLLPGQSLNAQEFNQYATLLRPLIKHAGPPRPIDQTLLTRTNSSNTFDELIALDPLRMVITSPKWRYALGFSWFDKDPSLVAGERYDYRITGYFPAQDLSDTIYGFHTIPSQTALPSEFYLDNLRIRLPQPTRIERAPDSVGDGLVQLSRRGIRIGPRDHNYWRLPSLDEWHLVIDFANPIKSVVLQLHPGHELKYCALLANGTLSNTLSLPVGESVRIDFPSAVEQLRLQGNGFLFAIRLPVDNGDLKPLSAVLPGIRFENSPLPTPPLRARVRNLQSPAPVPTDDQIPAQLPAPHTLGFEISWQPALLDGLTIWPPDQETPPIDAAIFQLEHREVTFIDSFPYDEIAALREYLQVNPPAPGSKISINSKLANKLAQLPLTVTKRMVMTNAINSGDLATIIELAIINSSAWQPVFSGDNWAMGTRDGSMRNSLITPASDLLSLFPEAASRSLQSRLEMNWRDVFDFKEGKHEILRPVPAPGTYHQYRVRAIDAIGRASASSISTDIVRLEKHRPPPLPVAAIEMSDAALSLPTPSGVQARVLVRDAPDLTPAELAILSSAQSAILLQWGWQAQQREQDSFAREFRIYLANQPLDAVAGVITNVITTAPGFYQVTINLDRAVRADAARGSNLEAGYPFYIRTHTAGNSIIAQLEARVPDRSGLLPVPKVGTIMLPLHLTPDLTRPPAWSKRVQVLPITTARKYQAIIKDAFNLSEDHPRDSVWVGVSSADDQYYVPDQLHSSKARAGNESVIVALRCEGKFYSRPLFDLPVAIEDLPTLVTAEPTSGAIAFDLDLTPYLSGSGLSAGMFIRPERISADEIFAAYRVSDNGDTLMRVLALVIDPQTGSESTVEISIANQSDRDAIIAGLKKAHTEALADRYLAFLASVHPARDRLFSSVTEGPVAFAPFAEILPTKAGRYLYRVRKGNAAGQISAGSSIARVVVRVPSIAPGAIPEKMNRQVQDDASMLRIQLHAQPELTHLLFFTQSVVNDLSSNNFGPAGRAELLRVPNRRDLYPENGIRLRAANNELLTPVAKSLMDADVILDERRHWQITFNINAAAGERIRIWCCSLTRDGIPSSLAGPWSVTIPPPPLVAPILTLTIENIRLRFNWNWPAGTAVLADRLVLEQSADGQRWQRISPPLAADVAAFDYLSTSGNWQYRLQARCFDGRTAYSNIIAL